MMSKAGSSIKFVKNGELWDRLFEQCVEFVLRHGDLPKRQSSRDYRGLAGWLARQRRRCKEGKLPADRKAKLEAIGIIWNKREHAFVTKCAMLKMHLEGYPNLASGLKSLPKQLKSWRDKMLHYFRRGKLSHKRMEMIKAAGYPIDEIGGASKALLEHGEQPDVALPNTSLGTR